MDEKLISSLLEDVREIRKDVGEIKVEMATLKVKVAVFSSIIGSVATFIANKLLG